MKKERPCERNATRDRRLKMTFRAGSCGAHLVAEGGVVGKLAVEFGTKDVADEFERVGEVLGRDAHRAQPLLLGTAIVKREHVVAAASLD